jgi:hypothetical protein
MGGVDFVEFLRFFVKSLDSEASSGNVAGIPTTLLGVDWVFTGANMVRYLGLSTLRSSDLGLKWSTSLDKCRGTLTMLELFPVDAALEERLVVEVLGVPP